MNGVDMGASGGVGIPSGLVRGQDQDAAVGGSFRNDPGPGAPGG
jgi:hypothetical protein